MDRYKKLTLVVVLLAVGIGTALLFRRRSEGRLVRDQPGAVAHHGDTEVAKSPSASAQPLQGVPAPENQSQLAGVAGLAADGSAPFDRQPDTVGSSARSEPSARPTNNKKDVGGAAVDTIEPPALAPSFQNTLRPPLPKLSNYRDDRRDPLARHADDSNSLPSGPYGVSAVREKPQSNARRPDPIELMDYTIVNGDTLRRIARRYMGDSERFMEIYQLNRDVLDNPDRLPIGRRIKIPSDRSTNSGDKPPATMDNGSDSTSARLVPVPDGVFSRERGS